MKTQHTQHSEGGPKRKVHSSKYTHKISQSTSHLTAHLKAKMKKFTPKKQKTAKETQG